MSNHFVTKWDTENSLITIPINEDYQYFYDVDWNNDGVFDDIGVTTRITHDYGIPGIYTIRIKGDFPSINLTYSNSGKKIIFIDQWGTFAWLSLKSAFTSTENLINKASDTPNLSLCTDLSFMFSGASTIGDESETANWDWDVSNITNMERMFHDAKLFNKNV